jgi:MFS family permease
LAVVAWGGNEFTPLLVRYRHVDGLTDQTTTLLLGVYVLGIIPGLFVGGPLSDRWGRRRVALPSAFIAAAGSLVLAFGEASPWILLAGRLLSGIALGLAMAAGTTWVKELSAPPFDSPRDSGSGARRASLATTAGLGAGAVSAAALAQFAPMPGILPYLVNVALSVAVGLAALGVPETRPASATGAAARALRRRDVFGALRGWAAANRRFLSVVVPVAPWVFGMATVAYAVLPGILAPRVPGFEVGFSGLLCLTALGCGFAVQPFARWYDSVRSARSLALALAIGVLGLAMAALAAATLNLAVTIVAAALLGASYGLLTVSGLLEVQRIAGPDDVAGLTGVYYSLTYVGFFLPAVLAFLNRWLSYPALFGIGVLVALATLMLLLRRSRRHLPTGDVERRDGPPAPAPAPSASEHR